MFEITPLVEPLSVDEAFLDLTGTEALHRMSPARTLNRLYPEDRARIGITVSVGLSHNKFLAKIASDLDKPRGFSVIGRAETLDFLAARPVSLIWGVGKVMRERLAKDGIATIGQLQQMTLTDWRGNTARWASISIASRAARDSRHVEVDALPRAYPPRPPSIPISPTSTPCPTNSGHSAKGFGAVEAGGTVRPGRTPETEDRRIPA